MINTHAAPPEASLLVIRKQGDCKPHLQPPRTQPLTSCRSPPSTRPRTALPAPPCGAPAGASTVHTPSSPAHPVVDGALVGALVVLLALLCGACGYFAAVLHSEIFAAVLTPFAVIAVLGVALVLLRMRQMRQRGS